jgi:Xaa-Pro aminopeptidase
MLKSRRVKLERFFVTHNLDAILFSNMANVRYLSGFSGSEGALLLTPDRGWLLCDSRYTTQAAVEAQDLEIREFSVKLDALTELINEQKLFRVGFEAAHTTVSAFMSFSGNLEGRELVALGADLDQIRSCKDAAEIILLKEVAALASASLEAVLPMLKPGIRESDLARELEFEMRRRGADGRAFDFIVASGERGAMPHGRASDRIILTGDLVTIDFGAVKNGYHSDETVTVAAGVPESRAAEIHKIVKEAHDLAIAAVKPGISSRYLDSIAREHIGTHGYGEYFGHGLGHGVGLEIHEKPTVSPRTEVELQEGMVFTVEPGIYIPGFGGVRIEDTVVVTSSGCEALTMADKSLLVLQ